MKRSLLIKVHAPILLLTLAFAPACGGGGDEPRTAEETAAARSAPETTGMMEETTSEDPSEDLSQLEVGPNEISNMLPAEGIEKAESQPLPADPPEGIRVYRATTNELVEGPIDYDHRPPTNGNHNPLWQNCGFYDEPLNDTNAVHSLDHGVVWITYRPDLSTDQIETLRRYGTERYVIISPYPGQDAPVTATSWRIQLPLDSATDPRLRQFVDDFRVSDIAPLAGNGCVRGVGDPAYSG